MSFWFAVCVTRKTLEGCFQTSWSSPEARARPAALICPLIPCNSDTRSKETSPHWENCQQIQVSWLSHHLIDGDIKYLQFQFRRSRKYHQLLRIVCQSDASIGTCWSAITAGPLDFDWWRIKFPWQSNMNTVYSSSIYMIYKRICNSWIRLALLLRGISSCCEMEHLKVHFLFILKNRKCDEITENLLRCWSFCEIWFMLLYIWMIVWWFQTDVAS